VTDFPAKRERPSIVLSDRRDDIRRHEGEMEVRNFDEHVLPHLNAAYGLARWLTANRQDAEDVVQEACLRAFRFFGGFRGGDARAWLLKIVRNTSYTWLRRNRALEPATVFDEEIHGRDGERSDASTVLVQRADRQLIERALSELPVRFREVLVLRELEGLSYGEIAAVAGIPKGTVMSSLARARRRLRESVINLMKDVGEARERQRA
jgi:RNA polymerase sigma-70 factor (ECF subfamily)